MRQKFHQEEVLGFVIFILRWKAKSCKVLSISGKKKNNKKKQ